MSIIKKFSIFESVRRTEVPKHFIPLNSIGYYLDPNDGNTYAMLKTGGYEDEPYSAEEYLQEDEETWEELSDEEKDLVNSVCKSCEDIVEPFIDWNLIEDIKDVALANEILDKGYTLKIEVKEQDVAEKIYVEWVAHDYDYKHYYKFFKSLFSQIENTNGDFSYNISVYRKNGPGGYLPMAKGSKDEIDVLEMIEQVKDMNPDKSIFMKQD